MAHVSATYSPEDNKLRLYASARLDAETYARIKKEGFKWAPRQDLFVAPMWTPAREDLLIELCGEVGDEDTSLTDRAEDRADRFGDYSEKRAQDANAARNAVQAIAENIPFGQPILVGHHSERHARKHAEKIENGLRRAVQMWDTAEYWKRRAAGALHHAKYKERPDVRARRIKGLEADLRKTERELADIDTVTAALSVEGLTLQDAYKCAGQHHRLYGLWAKLEAEPERFQEHCEQIVRALASQRGHYERWAAHYENRLTYERAMLADQGGLVADRFEIQVGGMVKVGGEWLVVKRVNRAAGRILSVSTNARFVPVRGIEEVQDYQAPSAEQAAQAKAVAKQPPLCNYPGEGFLAITKAEWDSTYKDYKGSRELGQGAQSPGGYRSDVKRADQGAELYARHRVRVIIRGGRLVPVFLTDAKRTDPQPAQQGEAVQAQLPHPLPVMPEPEYAPAATSVSTSDPEGEAFQAMRDQLKAGIQVVSAPQLFPTPMELARRMVELADIEPGMCVLEPSAGTGNLLRAIREAAGGSAIRTAIEISARLCDRLRITEEGADVINGDFLKHQPDSLPWKFDRIIMNPPFANGADIQHIRHALTFLKPGGRLVAVCANGPRQNAQLQPLACESGGDWEDLPANTFSESGTSVNTALVVINAKEEVN